MPADLKALAEAATRNPIRLIAAPFVTLKEQRSVTETPDAWIIPDSVLMVAGVFGNSDGVPTLRDWTEIEKTAAFYDGVPIIYPHPPGPVILSQDLQMVGGSVRNVRVDKEHERVIGDWVLLKHEVAGFKPHPNAIALNQTAIRRYLNGEPLESSPGYIAKVERSPGVWKGVQYLEVARNLVPNHLAALRVAGDHDPPACPWPTCGAGAAQESKKEASTQNANLKSETPPTRPSEIQMPDCQLPECKTKHESLSARALAAEGALQTIAAEFGIKESDASKVAGKAPEILAGIKEARAKATKHDDVEKAKHESLLGDVVKLHTGIHQITKEDEVKTVRESFSPWPVAALQTHKLTLEAALRKTGHEPTKDGTRIGAKKENDPAQAGAAKAPVGKDNGYGGVTVDWGAVPTTPSYAPKKGGAA